MDAAGEEAFLAVVYWLAVCVAEVWAVEEAARTFFACFVDGTFAFSGDGTQAEAVVGD